MTGIEERARAAGDELRGWRPPERSDGSPAAAAARTLNRRRTRRIAVGAAAVALAAGLVTWQWPSGRDRVEIGPPASQEEPDRPRPRDTSSTTTSTTAERTTASSDPADPGTGGQRGPTSETTESGAPPEQAGIRPAPSVRDIDFGALTYSPPCPSYDDSPVTLSGGRATVPLSQGARLDVHLGPISSADADGDGDEDAVVVVRCDFIGANVDSQVLFRVFGAGPDGRAETIGVPKVLEHVHDVSASGLAVTATMDVYAADDPNCCPSSGAEQVWVFEGEAFRLQSNRTIPPPGGVG